MSPIASLNAEERPLLRLIQQRDAILFVGSGISMWSGLPNWKQLLIGLADECLSLGGSIGAARKALEKNDMVSAADQLCDQLSPLEIAKVLRRQLYLTNPKPHEIHDLLFGLGIRRFVTTNYDNLLEQQVGLLKSSTQFLTATNRNLAELADIQKASADNFIFKPHGDLNDAESIVLSSEHYQRIFTDAHSPVKQALETIFVSRPILFLGYSIQDPDLKYILRTLRAKYRGNAGDLWAILPDLTKMEKHDLRTEFGIRAITYRTTKEGAERHTELLRILRSLGEEAEGLRRTIIATTSKASDKTNLTVGLARYAARLVNPAVFEIPIYANLPWGYRHSDDSSPIHLLDGQEISNIIGYANCNIVIEGAAGSGKSWSITRFMSKSAMEILDTLDTNATEQHSSLISLPIRLDCQIYDGDFRHLISSTVPPSLDLKIASSFYSIVFLVDSIDEMPTGFLETQSWSRDLAKIGSCFPNCRFVYFTRRRDLVPDPTLPNFKLQPLSTAVIENALEEISVDIDQISKSFLEDLRSPYVLELGRKLLTFNRTFSTAQELTAGFVQNALGRLPPYYHHDDIADGLVALAIRILQKGRETFDIRLFHEAMNSTNKQQDANQYLLDRLVEIGILRSEIDHRVRFAHRILTEYLASRWISKNWEEKSFSLTRNVGLAHMHNAIVWAAVSMDPDKRNDFFAKLVGLDYSVACAIADSAEFDRGVLWAIVLEKIAHKPPHPDLAHDLAYQLEDSHIPNDAHPGLVRLTQLRESELSGWALSKLLPSMTDDQVEVILDRIVLGDISFNEWNWAGYSLGQRLDSQLAEKLKHALRCSVSFLGKEEKKEIDDRSNIADNVRRGFESTIGGLDLDILFELLHWSRNQNQIIRGIVVSGSYKIRSKEVERFIVRQFDLDLPQSIFCLFLRLRYGNPDWQSGVPRFTPRRLDILTRDFVPTPKSSARWKLELLRTIVDQDRRWCDAIRQRSRSEKNKSAKRVMDALVPGKARHVIKRQVRHLLARGVAPSGLDKMLFETFDDLDPGMLFSEDEVLIAFRDHGPIIWETVGVFLGSFETWRTARFVVSCADEWIQFLHSIASEDPASISVDRLATFISAHVSSIARERVLSRANDPTDPLSNFVLVHLVCRMCTVTTDSLTDEAGQRLLHAFLRSEFDVDPFANPGTIATERYISETVIPYVRDDLDTDKLENLERILIDAGNRHGVRYRLE